MPLVKGHHRHESEYTQIPNAYLRDERLSLQARGLYAQILSHRQGWKITLTNLAYANGVGRDSIRRMIDELLKHGYIKRSEEKERNSKGQLTSYTYTTCDPTEDNPALDKPALDNPHHKNNNLVKQQLIKENLIDKQLSEFLEIYPRKGEAKKPIRQKLEQALKVASFEEILEGAKRYAQFLEWSDQYVAMAKTWLNQERWTEEHPQNPDKVKRDNYQKSMKVEYEYTQRQLAEMKEMENNAVAPPKCKHDKTLALCPICVREL